MGVNDVNIKLFSSGYESSTDIVLPGKLQATIRTAPCLDLVVCQNQPIRMCSLEFDIGNLYYMCESEISQDKAVATHRLKIPTDMEKISMDEGSEDVLINDASHENAVFTRCINTKESICFKLRLPSYCKAYYYKTYKLASRALSCVMIVAKRGAPTLDRSFLSEDKRMLILLSGNVTYDKIGAEFCMHGGYGALAFLSGDIQSFSSLGEKAFYYLWTKDEKYLPIEKKGISGLDCRMINDAAFSSGTDFRIYMEDLPDVVRAFVQNKDPEGAKKALVSIIKLSKNGTELYPRYPWQDNKSDSASAVYFLYAAMIYHSHTGDDRFTLSLYETLKNAVATILDGIKDNMLAEIPTSPLYEINVLKESSRYHASAVTTAMCIEVFYWLHNYFGKTAKKLTKTSAIIKDAAECMLENFEENFSFNDCIYHTSAKREDALRRQRFAFGRCVGCMDHSASVYEGILERTNKGVYLCPECYENNLNYYYERAKRVFTPTALATIVRSDVMREYIGEQRLLEMLWQSFEAYRKDLPTRVVKEDAYMLECAVILNKENQADTVYKVIENNADKLGRYTKFCDKNGCVGSDFHSGSCAAVYCALKKYKEYKTK